MMTTESAPRPSRTWARTRLWLVGRRGIVQATIDVLAWALAVPAAMALRFDFKGPDDWTRFALSDVAYTIVLAGILQVVIGSAGGLYRGRFRFGTFDEVSHLVGSVFITVIALSTANRLVFDRLVPHSVTIVGGITALLIMAATRYLFRLSLERRLRPDEQISERVLIFGAGEGGIGLLTSMLRNPTSPMVPVGLIDDSPNKSNLEVMGIPVLGTIDDLGEAARRTDATTVIIAIPSASSSLLRDVSQRAIEADLQVKVLPPLTEMLEGTIGVGDVRPITTEDLLGRHAVETDLAAISDYLTGRRVLVTGAGGSIGSELSYQLARFAPGELILLDRDESALHAVKLRLDGRAMLDTRDLVVADIRDRERLAEVFAEHRPDVVFHTAALKHLPLLEMHPQEALKTNVFATQHLLELAHEFGVERFVNISTDKAADPSSVLGYTKRLAEMLTTAAAHDTDGTFLSVRFGNVLGSRGSVLTAFRAQVDAGGPITVTDRDVTRFFMTVEEAVQLVIQAGAVGRDGEALVLDMGDPVRIDDVARRFAAQSERPIDIVYTGLRPGEKLHEVLFGAGEIDLRPAHPKISHVAVPPVAWADVTPLSACDDTALVDRLAALTTPLTDADPSRNPDV